MLLVLSISIILGVLDPGTVVELTPSPALIPTNASVPRSPLTPPDLLPVVHCISSYRNITNDSTPVVASTHWNVLVYIKRLNEYILNKQNNYICTVIPYQFFEGSSQLCSMLQSTSL